ncbi:MAG: geranylgeranylglycerol-phosphate geranylgeranyltransferase [Deinococcales bacterium]|nr:geranylgeranylglycerol-phosphate geranylgeranyltransferase [Chitinophagaceae bacterium]
MKIITSFFRLIRWPNLLFIALTMIMFRYCIIQPIFSAAGITQNIHGIYFWLLVTSYVFIAAAGYIINDYFDLNIDQINKPQKVIIAKVISRRWVLLWHGVLSLSAIILNIYIDGEAHNKHLPSVAAFACVVLLFLYSASLKKKFLIGNILVAAITAWVMPILTLCEANHLIFINRIPANFDNEKLVRLTFLYTGFAFIISLIREVVKDMEDMNGDIRYGCKTMPILWGINATKVFVAVWLIVLIAVLSAAQFYVIQFKWWLSIVYALIVIIVPLIYIFSKLFKAKTPQDFHQLSTTIKFVMFTGILSMIFFRFYP